MIEELNEVSKTINKIHHLTDDVEVKRLLMVAESQLASVRTCLRRENKITFEPTSDHDFKVNWIGIHIGNIQTPPFKNSTPIFESIRPLDSGRLLDIAVFLNELRNKNEDHV